MPSLDLEMPGPARIRASDLVHEALKDGRVSESDINDRVRRFLQLLDRVGKFSDRKPTPEERAVDKPEHRALIREAGAAGIVMLKNQGNILPIDVVNVKRIAVLGPLADVPSAHGGGSASMTCHYKVSPAEALGSRFGDRVEIVYSKGLPSGCLCFQELMINCYAKVPTFTERSLTSWSASLLRLALLGSSLNTLRTTISKANPSKPR
jgi:beta-glucosidase-like glycosyl hydrolase